MTSLVSLSTDLFSQLLYTSAHVHLYILVLLELVHLFAIAGELRQPDPLVYTAPRAMTLTSSAHLRVEHVPNSTSWLPC